MKGTITKIDNDKVTIIFPDGQSLSVDKSELPSNIQVGVTINLLFTDNHNDNQLIKTDPKELLSELLNPDD